MRRQRNKFQMKEQEVTSEKELNEAIHAVHPIKSLSDDFEDAHQTQEQDGWTQSEVQQS